MSSLESVALIGVHSVAVDVSENSGVGIKVLVAVNSLDGNGVDLAVGEDNLRIGQLGEAIGVTVGKNVQIVDISLADLGEDNMTIGIGVEVELLVEVLRIQSGPDLLSGLEILGLANNIVDDLLHAQNGVVLDAVEGIGD